MGIDIRALARTSAALCWIVTSAHGVTHHAASSLIRREQRSVSTDAIAAMAEGEASLSADSVDDEDLVPPTVELAERQKRTHTYVDGRDCQKLPDGFAIIKPDTGASFMVLCQNGWVLVQKRTTSNAENGNFEKNWEDYKKGWGGRSNLWLGLSKLHRLASPPGQLRIELADDSNTTRYAYYSSFSVKGNAKKYQMEIGGYSGTLIDSLSYHNGSLFSTTDQDNDKNNAENCAKSHGGNGGWWYNHCQHVNLNGKFYSTSTVTDKKDGICWHQTSWHVDSDCSYSYGKSYMMVKASATRRRYTARTCASGFSRKDTYCWDLSTSTKKLCGMECAITPASHIT